MSAAEVHILYRFFSESGDLLYVGITNNPQNRLRGHHRDKPWFGEVARSTMEHFGSRGELVAAENTAITVESPKYNIAGTNPQPDTPSAIRLRRARAQVRTGDASRFQAPDAIAEDDPSPQVAVERHPCPKCRRFFVIREVDDDGIPLNERVRCAYCHSEWTDAEWIQAISANEPSTREAKYATLIALLWDALPADDRTRPVPVPYSTSVCNGQSPAKTLNRHG